MAIFRCKMCGGDLGNNGDSVITCEYCNTKQALPKLDDEKRIGLYDCANQLRLNNEFDKAMEIYEQILNEDVTDADCYWSLVLCKYGIEYVEDYSLHKRVPTINRVQYTSIFDDSNYKMALKYADSYQKEVYKEEAKIINDIQREILSISEKEKPFDVFICYKESDNSGRRTKDSVLAQELYHELTKEGFKVFFSRITLEDKLGTAYEPYIFAALNSSKVMVVLGTKAEYFNAVWVKNEWSRYLSLIRNGERKILIPAYRDMDPYDLPEEFSHLQAQDMSKLGFMQDLIRGIKKIVSNDMSNKKSNVNETVVNDNVSSLIKRIFMFLEDNEYESADSYCERVLDIDPENELAYLGKLMVSLGVSKKENLCFYSKDFSFNSYYKKIVRFGSKELIDELNGYREVINIRNENNRKEKIYQEAIGLMRFELGDECKRAIAKFSEIQDYKDSDELIEKCKEFIKKEEEINNSEGAAYNNLVYNEAMQMLNNCWIVSDYEKVIKLLESIPSWKDSDRLIIDCKRKIESLKLIEDELEENDRIYNEAKKIMDNYWIVSEYINVIGMFKSISGWRDSDELLILCQEKLEELKIEEEEEHKQRIEDYKKMFIVFCVILIIYFLIFGGR